MSGAPFTAKRITRTYRQTINATPDRVFPLLCPVREAEWLDGWRYSMIYSQSGLVEEGAVFSTPTDGDEDTVWICTRHDPAQRVVEFTRFTYASRVCVLRIAVSPRDGERSSVDVTYTYTAITAAGNVSIEGFTEHTFLGAVTFWERSMNHWLETGERLERTAC